MKKQNPHTYGATERKVINMVKWVDRKVGATIMTIILAMSVILATYFQLGGIGWLVFIIVFTLFAKGVINEFVRW